MSQKVFIVTDFNSSHFDTMSYGDGRIRIYEKDNCDPRLGADLPFFKTPKDVIRHFLMGKKGLCQVAVECMSEFGFTPMEIQKSLRDQ